MKDCLEIPSADVLSQHLIYDPETGVLLWKVRDRSQFRTKGGWLRFNRKRSGKEAGHRHKMTNGKPHAIVIRICIDLVDSWFLAHRLIFSIMGATIPDGMVIDHKDRNPWNNKWDNLRLATEQQNVVNSPGRKRAKEEWMNLPKGVSFQKGRYKAQIHANGKKRHIGMYATPEKAKEAYDREALMEFGEFAFV